MISRLDGQPEVLGDGLIEERIEQALIEKGAAHHVFIHVRTKAANQRKA